MINILPYKRLFSLYIILLSFSCNSQKLSRDTVFKKTNTIVPNGIFQDSQNNYWFSVKGKGVYKYDQKKFIFYSKTDGLCSNEIISIQEDTLGNIYFDTFEGVCKFDGDKFTTLAIIPNDPSISNWVLNPNDLWFRLGWNHKGPYRYDGQYLYQLAFPEPEQVATFHTKYPNATFSPSGIYSLYKDREGAIWFGTASLGLCRYDGTNIAWIYEEELTTTPSGGAFGIRSIFEDRDGYFWFTNTRHRFHIEEGIDQQNGTSYINYQKEQGVAYTDKNGVKHFPYFSSIAEDNDGDLWMVTYDDGIWRNTGKELIHYPIKEDNKDVLLSSIYKDNHGTIWLVTQDFGLYKYHEKKFKKFKIDKE